MSFVGAWVGRIGESLSGLLMHAVSGECVDQVTDVGMGTYCRFRTFSYAPIESILEL